MRERSNVGELSFLFSNYSFEQLFLAIIVALIVTKLIIELIKYFYDKFRNYFGMKNKKETWENSTTESLDYISKKVDTLEEAANQRKERLIAVEKEMAENKKRDEKMSNQLDELTEDMKLVHERLQENTRSFLIDAHHKFCNEIQGIDDQSLQSMERRYLYYKTAGGNSFIDTLMDEVRGLPRINYATIKDQAIMNIRKETHG